MAINEISDVVTTNGLLIPKSALYKSQQSKSNYIARGVALFAALTLNSVLPYQANANQTTSPELNERIRLEEERKNAELKKQNEKPTQDFDMLKILDKNMDLKGENTKSTTANKDDTKKAKLPDTVKQEKKEISSLRRWYDQTRAAGLYTPGNYGALGLRGGSFKRGQEGGVSENPSQRNEIVLEGILGWDLKPLDLKERNIVLRILGKLYPDYISAKAAGSTETDGDGNTGRIRLMPTYKLGKKIVLEPIGQFTNEDISTGYEQTNKREVGARISFKINEETALYLERLGGNGRYQLGNVRGGTPSKNTVAGLQLKLSKDASLEAGIRKTDINYTGLQDENSDNVSEADLGLVVEVNPKFLLYMRGIYERGEFKADDRRIPTSRKVDSVKAEAGILYKLSNGFLELTGGIGHKVEEVSIGFVYPIGNSDKK